MSTGRSYEEHYGIPRLNWESDHKWQYRTIFIDVNKHFYTGDSLASYSMAWSNWKFMGNTYGTNVQTILEACHKRLPTEVDSEIKSLHEAARPKVDFVVSREHLGCSNVHLSHGKPLHASDTLNKQSVKESLINFTQATDMEFTVNDLNVLHNDELTTSKSATNQTGGSHGSEKAAEKKLLGKRRYDSYPKLDESNLGHHMLCKLGWKGSGGIGKREDGIMEPVFVSATKGRKGLGHEFEDRNVKLSNMEETLISEESNISNISQISTGKGKTRDIALKKTAKKGPKILKERHPIIYKSELGFEQSIEHDHLKTVTVREGHSLQQEIVKKGLSITETNTRSKLDESNVGHSLLRKMGWKGSGGIGKHEDGIAEPIVVNAVKGRQGLGHVFEQSILPVAPQPEFSNVPGLTLYLAYRGEEKLKVPSLIISYSCRKCKLSFKIVNKGLIKLDKGKKLDKGNTVFSVIMMIDGLAVATCYGKKRKEARKNVAKQGLDYLLRTHPVIYENEGAKGLNLEETSKLLTTETWNTEEKEEEELIYLTDSDEGTTDSDEGTQSILPEVPQPEFSNVPGLTLYLKYRGEEKFKVPSLIINYSCIKCKMSFKVVNKGLIKLNKGHTVFFFIMMIDGLTVATYYGSEKEEARINVAKQGLDYLLRTHPVIYENEGVKGPNLEETSKLQTAEPLNAETEQEELIPGLIIQLPYRGEDETYPDAKKIIEESCSACNCSINLRINNEMTKGGGHYLYYELFIENKLVSLGCGDRVKKAINNAYSKGLGILRNRQPITYSSDVGHTHLKKDEIIPGLTLYLLSPGDTEYRTADAIMHKSCQQCDVSLKVLKYNKETRDDGTLLWCVMLIINSKEVAKGYGISISQARNDAAANAIRVLIQNNQPVAYKSEIDTDVVHDHTMLKTVQINNKGLNLVGYKPGDNSTNNYTTKKYITKKQVTIMLLDFIESSESEIRFSVNFGNRERALIHRESEKLDLKHRSYGLDDDRYIVVSKHDTIVIS